MSEIRVPNLDYYTESAFALASVYQAGGREVKARETVHLVCEHLLGVGNDTLLRRADEALYRAKRTGRDRVVTA